MKTIVYLEHFAPAVQLGLTAEDELIEGAVDEERIYTQSDFNRIIEIEERERLC